MPNINKVGSLLKPYSDAGYACVAIETSEERRVVADICDTWPAKEAKVMSIAAAGGLRDERQDKYVDAACNFPKAFQAISNYQESFLIVFDFQHMISAPVSYRPLLHSLPSLKAKGSMVVLVAPSWNLPAELRHEIPVINMPLPSVEELKVSLDNVKDSVRNQVKSFKLDEPALLSAARGLTLAEAENVFALSAPEDFSPALVEREKMKLVRSNYMTVEKALNPSALGGLGLLKEYVTSEVLSSKEDEQLMVKGLLLVGVPGTGKSLSAKIISALLKWPLVRLDISAAKGSLVGQSESNIRNAFAIADAISPCVLWLDEVEKAVGGHASSAVTDGGTTLSMLGTILTWMQEHTTPVTVVATCNDYKKLPAELTRAGRWDEKFFLDIPTEEERMEIAKIHLTRLRCECKIDEYATEITAFTPEWTGAEVEQLIKSVARRTKRKVNIAEFHDQAQVIIPISKTAGIEDLRSWANDNLRKANSPQKSATGRKMKGAFPATGVN